jgi:hypothetical protein
MNGSSMLPMRFLQHTESLPDEDLPVWRDTMIETALKAAEEDGFLEPVILGIYDCLGGSLDDVRGPGMLAMQIRDLIGTHEDKAALASVLPNIFASLGCRCYLMLTEVYYATAPLGSQVSLHDASLERKEAIFIHSEQADGSAWSAVYPYDRGDDGKISLDRDSGPIEQQGLTGMFTNLLRTARHAPQAEA